MKQIMTFSFLLLLAYFNITPINAAQNDIIGKPAPPFALLDLNGNKVSLSDYKNKVVILDFWATWCPPCIKEIPHFIELYKEYKNQGLVIVGISLDLQGISIVKAFNKIRNLNNQSFSMFPFQSRMICPTLDNYLKFKYIFK